MATKSLENLSNDELFRVAFDQRDVMRQIRDARDYCAEHGDYPVGMLGPDQEFDDWVADLVAPFLED